MQSTLTLPEMERKTFTYRTLAPRMIKPFGFGAFFLFALVISSYTPAEKPREINTSGYSGIVYSKHAFIRSKFFTPTDAEVHAAEELLEKRIHAVLGGDFDHSEESMIKKQHIAAELPNYKRRYYGLINTVKKKILYIEFIHQELITSDAWKHPKWFIDGGGHQFWSIRFNISTGLFYDLWINAELAERDKKRKKNKQADN
jgi:hypothetical protein